MPWFKVDDTLPFHAKVVAAGNAAMGLWVRAGAWCSQQLTDGFVPRDIAAALGTPSQAARLVTARLWIEKDDGYEFWQWGTDGRQPSRAKVEAERHAARERQERARERAKSQRDNTVSHAVTSSVTNEVTDAVSHTRTHGTVTPVVTVPPTRPDPTRPEVPTSLSEHRNETHRASPATTPPPKPTNPADARCTAHVGVADPGPCNGCRLAREQAERELDRERRDAQIETDRRARNCTACDGVHIIDDQGRPTRRKCDHRRTA